MIGVLESVVRTRYGSPPIVSYTLEMIRELEPVHRALELQPGISFVMDAANVWCYGVKDGLFWEYDEPFDELRDLGEIESQINEKLDPWEAAKE